MEFGRSGIPGQDGKDGQLVLSLAEEATCEPAELARRMEVLDRRLCVRPLAVRVLLRKNRRTLGSLRQEELSCGAKGWKLSLASSLMELDSNLVEALAFSLLLRARKRAVPREIKQNLARLRELWDAERRETAVESKSDPWLANRLELACGGSCPGEAVLPAVDWGSWSSARTLARFDSSRNRIEVHPALKHSSVPSDVIVHLLHHEWLHARLGPQRQGSRLVHHHREFRDLESAHPAYQAAQDWIRTRWTRRQRNWLRKKRTEVL